MIRFINREEEMAVLEEEWKRKNASFVVVYGRRRVGKTELALRFLEKHRGIYYLADRKTYPENLEGFQRAAAEYTHDEVLSKAKFRNWNDLFSYLLKNLKEKTIIVIDEFPYLIEKGVLEEFQKIWDTLFSHSKHMLILIGSSISLMERNLLSYSSPLYGRRTAQLRIEPLRFWHVREFFPDYNFEDLLKVYSVVDGIPRYLTLLSPELSFHENMVRYYLNKNYPLYEDCEILLKDELRETRRYFSILEAIAQGKRSFSEIKNSVDMESNVLARYLNILRSMGVVMEEKPLFSKRRMKRYRLADNYFQFWFRYVYPNRWLIESGKGERLIEIIEEDFNKYVSEVFENVIRSYMSLKMDYDLVGNWWNRRGDEIDVIAIKGNEITFGEIKWRNRKVDCKVLENLKKKSEMVYTGKKFKKVRYLLISKYGFTERCRELSKSENVILWDLNSLERMMFQ